MFLLGQGLAVSLDDGVEVVDDESHVLSGDIFEPVCKNVHVLWRPLDVF